MAEALLLGALMAGCVLVSAFFSASETAAFQIGPSDLRDLQAKERVQRALRQLAGP